MDRRERRHLPLIRVVLQGESEGRKQERSREGKERENTSGRLPNLQHGTFHIFADLPCDFLRNFAEILSPQKLVVSIFGRSLIGE